MAESKHPSTHSVITCEIVDSHMTVTFGQLCRSCGMDADWVARLVDEGILDPVPSSGQAQRWHFPTAHIKRARTAARLHRDLSINVAGLALALDLMDEIEDLRARLDAAQERQPGPL